MENFFYENRPDVYLLISLYAFINAHSQVIPLLCAMTLLGCGFHIKRMRQIHRKYSGNHKYKLADFDRHNL